ncbi:MAG: phosphohydrolase [Proteobacteria bacterium]|nr:phosphohydrolase [Pseudomonadota bacterium]
MSIPFPIQRFLDEFPRHQPLLQLTQKTVMEDTDLAHDLQHIFRVYFWAIKIAQSENQDADLVGAAALIHDLINIPKESEQRKNASDLSATKGLSLLFESGYSSQEVMLITDAVSSCSWSKGEAPKNQLGAILQDADRLDAIGAIGVMRNIACAQAMSSRGNDGSFYHPQDPIYQKERSLDDRHFAIDHFFKKLLLLKEGFHTSIAQKESNRRHAFLLSFLDSLSLDLPH